jgi:hypothetical protein
MDIDRLLAEADPARSIAIPGPDSPEARQALGQLTKSAPRLARRRPHSRTRRLALAGVVSAAMTTLAERARGGGLRRARSRRIQLAASVAAACVAVATGLVVATQAGIAPSGGGALAPVTVPLPAVSPLLSSAPAPRAGLPPAASVGQAMLTAYNAASGDVVYERIISVSRGTVVDETQVWDWPAQPVPGQQARERSTYARRTRAFAKALTLATDHVVAYKSPAPGARSETFQLTMVCYPGGSRFCGYAGKTTPAGTWTRVSFRSAPIDSAVGPGSTFNPAVIVGQMTIGQWRVVGLARLDGQPAIEVSETSKGTDRLLPRPVLLWVNARTYLPIRVIWGPSTAFQQWDFAYLPPTSANLALLRVPIPRGYPRSDPFRS